MSDDNILIEALKKLFAPKPKKEDIKKIKPLSLRG